MGFLNEQQQASPEDRTKRAESELFEFLADNPAATFNDTLIKANALGFNQPSRATEWARKKLAEDDKRRKGLQQAPDQRNLPTGTQPATQQVIDLLGQAGLPTTGLEQPIERVSPLGRGPEGQPTTPGDIMKIIGRDFNLPSPGMSQPGLRFFGEPALRALPQEPIPGATVPSSLIPIAASRVGAVAKEGKRPGVGVDREGKASAMFGPSFNNLSQKEKAAVDKSNFQDELLLKAAEGSAAAIAKLQFGMRKQRGRVVIVTKAIDKVQGSIQKNPAIMGVPGTISRILVNLVDQLKASAHLVSPDLFDSFNDLGRHVNIFEETGIENAKLQAQLLSLAINLTLAEGFEGRAATDNKININLKRLTGAFGSSGGASIAIETLQQLKEEVTHNYNIARSSAPENVEEALLPPPPLPEVTPREFISLIPDLPLKSGIEILRRRPE